MTTTEIRLDDAAARERRKLWTLDPEVRFLNHGSFGACPREVLEEQREWQAKLERQPVAFFRALEPLLDAARESLAATVGADERDLVFVPNATSGVNAVLRSLELKPGDELLTTDHAYNACKNVLAAMAALQGCKVVVAKVPFPIATPSQAIEPILAAVTPRTRLAMIDHVTAPTGLVFPVAQLARELESRGVEVLIDGAHAPGMVPLALDAIGASYYTGNCHKWLCTPKGSAFLHVRRDRQTRKPAPSAARSDPRALDLRAPLDLPAILPLAIGHGVNSTRTDRSRFRLLWDLAPTDDFTPWLCLPRALGFLSRLFPGGLGGLQAHNHALATEAQKMLCESLGIDRPAPAEMLGALVSIPLPDRPAHEAQSHGIGLSDPLAARLLEKHRIELPINAWPSREQRVLRVACQAYVQREELDALCTALREELAAERRS